MDSLPQYARPPFRYRWEDSDGYQVSMELKGAHLNMVASNEGRRVGQALFAIGEREFRGVSMYVQADHQRSELATLMCLMAEGHARRTLEAPIVMTDDGKRFWSAWSHPKSVAARHRIRRRMNGVPTVIRVIWYWLDVWLQSVSTRPIKPRSGLRHA